MVRELLAKIDLMLAGYNWRSKIVPGRKKSFLNAATGAVAYLRSPATPGNQVAEGEEPLSTQFRRASGQLARAWALSTGSDELAPVRFDVQFYEEVRVYMAKYDASDRQARGEPIPEEIQRLLASLIAESTASVVDVQDFPDQQPAAIKLVMEQMESMAPRYALRRQNSDD